MTAPQYYASTSGIVVDRFLKYGLFAFAYGAGLATFREHDKATRFAQSICFAGAAALTTSFLGMESRAIDNCAREAVSAGMGVDPSKIEFSDYMHSSNVIAQKAADDLMRLQKWRYGTDMLFMLPVLVEASYGKLTGKQAPPSKALAASLDSRMDSYNPNKYSRMEALVQGHNGWAMSPYAGKAAYWVYETFGVDKTAYYDVVKLRENYEATGKDISANDLKSIYQRARNDRKLPMVALENKQDNDVLRELLTRMADAYNQHDGKFGVPEIIYLIGENKINIYAADQKTFSPEAVKESHRQIDKVLAIGLSGIREENKRRRAQSRVPGVAHPETQRSVTDRITNRAVDTIQSILGKTRIGNRRPEEYISERDPTNMIGFDSGLAR